MPHVFPAQLAEPRTRAPAFGAVTARSFEGWVRIFDPHVQLVIHEREACAHLASACASLCETGFDRVMGAVEPGRTGVAKVSDWLHGAEPLARDMLTLSEVFADLLGATSIGIRVARVRTAMCPNFHSDRVLARLVVTYVGPGSEWLREEDVLGRAGDSEKRNTSGPLRGREGSVVQSIPTSYPALMKGERWPGNTGRGLVHRSPAQDASCHRLIATFDPLD